MDDSWYDELDGTGLAAAIRAGDVTAAEVVDAAIARIEAVDPLVHALVAERSTRRGPRRPLRSATDRSPACPTW